jgi:quinolinate synthase
MKMVTPSILLDSMEKMQYEVNVEESIREKAKKSLDRMLEI